MDLNDLIGLSILNIYCKKENPETNGYDEIVLHLSNCYLKFIVDDETDEIIYKIFTTIDVTGLKKAPWADQLVGNIIGQTWGLENDKGYSDLICIGLNTVIPSIVFTAIAGEIEVGFVNYI